MKRFLAIMATLVLVLIWFATLAGFGDSFKPISKQIKLGLDISGGVYVVLEAKTNETGSELQTTMEQTQVMIENRVNEMGLSEPIVTTEGQKRIRVELPGVEDASEAINQIGRTAKLSFRTADGKLQVDGKNVKDASVDTDQENGGYLVKLSFDDTGRKGFAEATRIASEGVDNDSDDSTVTGSSVAAAGGVKEADLVEYIQDETTGVTTIVTNSGLYPIVKDKKFNAKKDLSVSAEAVSAKSVLILLDDELISMPTAEEEIDSNEATITGQFTNEQAKNLALLIRGGALPVELTEVESSEIGASIGMGALKNSITAGIIGICLIVLLMILMYRIFGFAASLALFMYVPVVLWIIVLFKGVLTLPGIAGIILSIGMAIDANVIIFARVKEEALSGKSIALATSQGFKQAMRTIIDSQVTTLIAAIVLYAFGTGAVKGFALTLMIGIFVGVFTALIITNCYMQFITDNAVLARKKLIGFSPLAEDKEVKEKTYKFSFIKNRKIYYIISVAIIVLGIGFGLIRGYNMGIDFTGGTRIQISLDKSISQATLTKAFKAIGAEKIEIISLGTTKKDKNNVNKYQIKTTDSLTTKDRDKLTSSLNKGKKKNVATINSFEQFGPSMGRLITENAIKSILLAALFMLIYIAIRFKWRFGVAAVVGLFHDVAIMIAFYGIFHITVNSPFIAAILTVVGYSINDTIVIFDRVRENLDKFPPKMGLNNIIDKSIYQTLVRSLMTSLTTVIAIVPLIILGGSAIREFALPLLVGILTGTASSIFFASSLFFDLAKKSFEIKKKYIGAERKN
ncbi:MAG: protein translocase subunit SecD, partial [Clostridiales Family XIII bacterium]|nr:protein translocase subunit SecD [Clostridiales Family XIII bacterium]